MSYFENPKVAKPVTKIVPVVENKELVLQSPSSSTQHDEELKEEDENVKSVWCGFGDVIRRPARLNPTHPKPSVKLNSSEQVNTKQYSDPELDQMIAGDESVRDYLADKKQTKLSDFIRFR